MRVTYAPQCARALAVVVAVLGCGPVQAHLNSTGMGPVYDGVTHFLTSPQDLMPALALAMLAGLRGAASARRTLFTLPAAWLIGGVAGLNATAANGGTLAAAFWFLLLGGLVVADVKLSLRGMTALASMVGLVHGYFNGTGMGFSATAIVSLLGLVAAVFVLVVLITALVVPLRALWARVAVRVAGSWIAASGLFMLGWALRGL